jgi:hypothetical protein
MTGENVNTLRRRQAIARYGKALRYPLCQAALTLWQIDSDLLTLVRDSVEVEGVIRNAKRSRNEAESQVRRFGKAGKLRLAKQAGATLNRIDALLRKVEANNELQRKCISTFREIRLIAEARFAHESIAALRARNFDAFKALERASKRWTKPDNPPDYRTLEILKFLGDKASKRAWDEGGAAAGYLEAARGPDRKLSDAGWPQLSARELHARLVSAKALLPPRHEYQRRDQMHEVRRLAKRLGIKLSPDRRGPKRKTEELNPA